MNAFRTTALAVASALALAGCKAIGPTVGFRPGPNMLASVLMADKRTCMDATDRQVQPFANRLNVAFRTTQQIEVDNQRIQDAYNAAFMQCMVQQGAVADTDPPTAAGTAIAVAAPRSRDAPANNNVGTLASDRGPAAESFRQWFTRQRKGCFDQQGKDAHCSLSVNMRSYKLYQGDAGHGLNADVLVVAWFAEDPTGNGEGSLIGYLRREGSGYRFVKEFQTERVFGVAPRTDVQFDSGTISFLAMTNIPSEGRNSDAGRTPMMLSIN